MWRLMNWLFKYDYIAWNNAYDNGTARVRVMPDGKVYYYQYKHIGYIKVITIKEQVLWLTCKPEKYLKEE